MVDIKTYVVAGHPIRDGGWFMDIYFMDKNHVLCSHRYMPLGRRKTNLKHYMEDELLLWVARMPIARPLTKAELHAHGL